MTGSQRAKLRGAWFRTQATLAWLEAIVPAPEGCRHGRTDCDAPECVARRPFTPTREQIDGLKRDLDKPAATGCRHDRKRRCATCREVDERLALAKTYKTGVTPKNTGRAGGDVAHPAEPPALDGGSAESPTHAGVIDAQPATDGAAADGCHPAEVAVAAGSDPALPSTRMVPILACTSIGCSRPAWITVDGTVTPPIRYCHECWDASLRARGCMPLTDQEPQAPAGATTEGLEPQATQDATAPAGAKARRKRMPKTATKEHRCERCGKTFGSSNGLGGHLSGCNRRAAAEKAKDQKALRGTLAEADAAIVFPGRPLPHVFARVRLPSCEVEFETADAVVVFLRALGAIKNGGSS